MGDFLGDGESQAVVSFFMARLVRAVETLKDGFFLGVGDSRTVVGHG